VIKPLEILKVNRVKQKPLGDWMVRQSHLQEWEEELAEEEEWPCPAR